MATASDACTARHQQVHGPNLAGRVLLWSNSTAERHSAHSTWRLTRQIEEDFDAAAERIKPVTGPNNDEMLEIYALFKQANVGDNDTPRPGLLDLKGKKKWDAWASKKGMSQEDAMKAYIELVEAMVAKYAPASAPAPA